MVYKLRFRDSTGDEDMLVETETIADALQRGSMRCAKATPDKYGNTFSRKIILIEEMPTIKILHEEQS